MTFMSEKFSGEDPIVVLEFLRNFRDAADHNNVSEGAAARLMSYFLTGVAMDSVKSRLSEGHLYKRPPLYPHLVAWMLKEYATPLVLRDAYTAVVAFAKGSDEDELAFASRLRRASQRAGNVLTEKALNPAVACMVTELTKVTNLTDLQVRASNMERALRERTPRKPEEESRRPLTRPRLTKAPAAAAAGRSAGKVG